MIPIDPRYNSLFSCSWWGLSPPTPLFRPAHIGHVFLFRFLRFHWRSFHRLRHVAAGRGGFFVVLGRVVVRFVVLALTWLVTIHPGFNGL